MKVPGADYSPIEQALASKRNAIQSGYIAAQSRLVLSQDERQQKSFALQDKSLELQQHSLNLNNWTNGVNLALNLAQTGLSAAQTFYNLKLQKDTQRLQSNELLMRNEASQIYAKYSDQITVDKNPNGTINIVKPKAMIKEEELFRQKYDANLYMKDLRPQAKALLESVITAGEADAITLAKTNDQQAIVQMYNTNYSEALKRDIATDASKPESVYKVIATRDDLSAEQKALHIRQADEDFRVGKVSSDITRMMRKDGLNSTISYIDKLSPLNFSEQDKKDLRATANSIYQSNNVEATSIGLEIANALFEKDNLLPSSIPSTYELINEQYSNENGYSEEYRKAIKTAFETQQKTEITQKASNWISEAKQSKTGYDDLNNLKKDIKNGNLSSLFLNQDNLKNTVIDSINKELKGIDTVVSSAEEQSNKRAIDNAKSAINALNVQYTTGITPDGQSQSLSYSDYIKAIYDVKASVAGKYDLSFDEFITKTVKEGATTNKTNLSNEEKALINQAKSDIKALGVLFGTGVEKDGKIEKLSWNYYLENVDKIREQVSSISDADFSTFYLNEIESTFKNAESQFKEVDDEIVKSAKNAMWELGVKYNTGINKDGKLEKISYNEYIDGMYSIMSALPESSSSDLTSFFSSQINEKYQTKTSVINDRVTQIMGVLKTSLGLTDVKKITVEQQLALQGIEKSIFKDVGTYLDSVENISAEDLSAQIEQYVNKYNSKYLDFLNLQASENPEKTAPKILESLFNPSSKNYTEGLFTVYSKSEGGVLNVNFDNDAVEEQFNSATEQLANSYNVGKEPRAKLNTAATVLEYEGKPVIGFSKQIADGKKEANGTFYNLYDPVNRKWIDETVKYVNKLDQPLTLTNGKLATIPDKPGLMDMIVFQNNGNNEYELNVKSTDWKAITDKYTIDEIKDILEGVIKREPKMKTYVWRIIEQCETNSK